MRSKSWGALRGDLFLGLISALVGVLVTALLGLERGNGIAPTWLLFTTLILLIVFMSFLVSKVEDVNQALRAANMRSEGGFRYVERSEISLLAAQLALGATAIRVCGTARQDVASIDATAQAYLRATERRLRQRQRLFYRRITSGRVKSVLADHVDVLLSEARNRNHDVQIALVDNIECMISYQVFDQQYALVIVDSPTIPGVRDNAVAFVSSEPTIVAAFAAHFDNAWSHRHPIRDSTQFRALVAVSE